MRIEAGQFGLDAASNNGWQPDALHEAGVSFVSLYGCQDTIKSHFKIATVATWERLREFTRVFNYEWYEGRCIEEGMAKGDAFVVKSLIAEGRPTDVVAVSCDMNVGGFVVRRGIPGFATRPDELPVCARELAIHQHTYALDGIRLGMYGGGWLIRWLCDHGAEYGLDTSTMLFWQPVFAWSEDGEGGHYIPPETHILQAGGSVIGGVNSDHNRCIKTYSTEKDNDMNALNLYRVAAQAPDGTILAARHIGIGTGSDTAITYLAMGWWLNNEGLYNLLGQAPFNLPEATIPVAAFANAVRLGDVPPGEPSYAWTVADGLFAPDFAQVTAIISNFGNLGHKVDTLNAKLAGIANAINGL